MAADVAFRWRMLRLPFTWIRRGCFDWGAARVCIKLAITGKPRRSTDGR